MERCLYILAEYPYTSAECPDTSPECLYTSAECPRGKRSSGRWRGSLLGVWASFLLISALAPSSSHALIFRRAGGSLMFNVLDYGAKADGTTDDSAAIMRAFKAACAAGHSAMLFFPQGRVVRSAFPLLLQGPCAPGALKIQIKGRLQFDAVGRTPPATPALLEVKEINSVSFFGIGSIHGNGTSWWAKNTRPHLLKFTLSNNTQATGITTLDPPRMHVVFDTCTNVVAQGLITNAPDLSPNTDSIHLSSVQNALITNCTLHSGDDCVSIVSDSSNIVVSNLRCTAGHGYSIGSLGYFGDTACLSNITFKDSTLVSTTNGLRIKTYRGGRGIVRNVVYQNIIMQNVYNPIILDQFYCDRTPCSRSGGSDVALYNIQFSGISGTTLDGTIGGGIQVNCSNNTPCTKLAFNNVNIVARVKGQPLVPWLASAFGTMSGVLSPPTARLPLATPTLQQQGAIQAQAALCSANKLTF